MCILQNVWTWQNINDHICKTIKLKRITFTMHLKRNLSCGNVFPSAVYSCDLNEAVHVLGTIYFIEGWQLKENSDAEYWFF